MQLNVSDLRTALVQIKAQAAHSVAIVVNHALYEKEEESYLTHRIWVADGIPILSTFRYKPSLEGFTGIDKLGSELENPQSKNLHNLATAVKIRPERLDLGLVRFSELRQLSVEVNVLNFAIIDPAHIWLGKRLEDVKGGGDAGETAGPSNKEAPAARKTIGDVVGRHGGDDAGE
ncbi:meiosis mei2 [Fusarium napiforme]|uniref:Meiosis mei2 n=1 Tax=Fusarium napiforme TaxID=42672 RepID=A0A8H5JW71_9HYPO|nr:meiosis mei2 [Fusarium napiforme]